MNASATAAGKTETGFRFHREYGLLLLFLAIFIYFSATTEGFLTTGNVLRVLRVHVHLAVLAIGMTLVILSGGIDLSAGSATALAAVVLGQIWLQTRSPVAALLAGAATGAACGAFNGVLVSKGRVPPLIVTLATLSVFRGLAFALGGSQTVNRFPPAILSWARDDLLGIPVPAWIVAALFLGSGIYLARTDGGRAIYAVGANAAAARLSGVPVPGVKLRLYLFSGLMAGLAAIFYAAWNNSVRGDIGREYELLAITMVVLGGASVAGGEGSIAGTALGFLTLVFIRNGIELQGRPAELHGVIVAVLLIGALLLDAALRRRRLAPGAESAAAHAARTAGPEGE